MKRIVSAFLALIMLFSAASASFTGYAAEKKFVADVLSQIQKQGGFVPGETAAVVGNCYGFISAVCEKLYGVKYQEGLNGDGYTCKHKTGLFYTVKTYKTTSSNTADCVEDIISFFVNNAYPGDIVHYASLSGSSHTVMIQSIDDEKMSFYHSNYQTRTLSSATCHIDTIYWKSFRENPTKTIYNSDNTIYSHNSVFYNKQKRGGIGITINRFTDYEKYFYPKYLPPVLSVSRSSSTSIKMKWTAVAGASRYRVEYKKNSDANYSVLTYTCTSTSYDVKNLTIGVKYNFRVAAYAGDRWQEYSNVVTKRVQPPTVSSVTFRPSSTGLKIKWAKKQDITGVRIYKSGSSGFTADNNTLIATLSGASGEFIDTNIKYGVTYYYKIVRYLNYNNAEYTSTESKAFAGTYLLKKPTVTFNRISSDSLTFSFEGDKCQDSFDYYLVSDTNPNSTATVNTDESFLTLEKLNLGEHYTIFVRERTKIATGEYGSLTVQAAPVSVSGITATPKLKGIRVDYKPQKTAAGYYVYRSSGGAYESIAKLTNPATDYYLDKTVKYAASYQYLVKSYEIAENGNEIIGDSGTPSAAASVILAAPADLKITRTSPSRIKLSWNAVNNANRYDLQYKVKGGSWKSVTGLKKRRYLVKKLSTGKKYYFRVRAANYVGNGSYSKALKAKALPPAPSAPKLSDSGSAVKVSFKTKSYASGYYIYRAAKADGKYKLIANVQGHRTKSFKDYTVSSGNTYYYKLVCYMVVDGKTCKSSKSDYSSIYYS